MIDIYRFVFYMNEMRFIVSLNAQLIHRVELNEASERGSQVDGGRRK